MAKITFHVDDELKIRFQKYCVQRKLSMKAVLLAGMRIALTNKSGIEVYAKREMDKK